MAKAPDDTNATDSEQGGELDWEAETIPEPEFSNLHEINKSSEKEFGFDSNQINDGSNKSRDASKRIEMGGRIDSEASPESLKK